MSRIGDIEAVILANRVMVPGYNLLTLELSIPMTRVVPGQFVMLRVPSADIFLRRPFSIYDYRKRVLSILFKVVGRGTSELAAATPGEKAMVLGPLGNGFTVLQGHRPVLVAGGIGIAGIYFLWLSLQKKASLFWGCSTGNEVGLLNDIIPCNPHVATLDGSSGCRGNVVELLSQRISQLEGPVQIFACGPEAMFASLKELLEDRRVPCQVLLEERMACGLGLCFGCVRKTTDKEEPYKRVCKEGPVFDLWQISL